MIKKTFKSIKELIAKINWKRIVYFIIATSLALLWTYAVISKWGDHEVFEAQLARQPIPSNSIGIVFWLLPGVELVCAFLIAGNSTRQVGLYLSLAFLVFFTVYVALALSGMIWEKRPCACGGLFAKMSWKSHLIFNTACTVLNFIAIKLHRKLKTTQGKRGELSERAGRPKGIITNQILN
ncbi:MauE/DoxX family redox-associated membrane protein [Olivibacter domesticus]|uniref:Methylamine utilisation protein MauE domain-containing protein n=1 Tax=Olivibacter domesticus TaxID=407022 RepID=A0A1H7JP99_OLID1|nr:MauE/DoxX family redox-associated membrane protein [Olivibacter domesticus]SEK75750.1 hypothetical protein SAMN05661044_01066 [Olivibacter domesticus]